MRRCAAILALGSAIAATPVLAADPPVPIGQDPGGTAVAFVTAGIDYTLPQFAKVLARDGEGEIIAWDFADDDNRPYATETEMFDTAMMALLAAPATRIVPIRVKYSDPLWLAKAASFAERTPATVVVTPIVAVDGELGPMAEIARRFARLHLILVPAGAENSPKVESAAAGLANVSVLGAALCKSPPTAEPVSAVAIKLCAGR